VKASFPCAGVPPAYRICRQVYILGRMGNAGRALHLIVERLHDVPQAIEFVQQQHDDDLWELLISLALGSADMTGVDGRPAF
jgi:vacuolar protein sorting-associated protein 41